MTDELRLLEAARATWRVAGASEREQRDGVAHVRHGMIAGRSPRPRRFIPFAAISLAAVAAVAYAATIDPVRSKPTVETANPTATATTTTTTTATTTTTTTANPTATATATTTTTANPTTTTNPTTNPNPTAIPLAAPRRPSTWSDVRRALGAGDSVAAETALRDLAAHGDTATRAKALLGIAQLALARGDGERAARLGREVAAMHGIDPALTARATEFASHTARPGTEEPRR